MILYPAIDIKGGVCVRLAGGRMSEATIFNDDPGAQARLFEAAGFDWLHIVDLDGAFAGEPANGGAISDILARTTLRVQIGGGVRSMAHAQAWLDAGAARVILGTAAVRDPAFVREAARAFPDRVAVGIDARGGKAAIQGWAEQTNIDAVDLARSFEDAGVAALIVTDIARDGLKTGVNAAFTSAMANAVTIPVIASGGVRAVADICTLKAQPGRAIHGVILGRALYDGDIAAADALAAAQGAEQ